MGILYKFFAHYTLAAFPEISWKRSKHQQNVYLTFDDGPDPEVTPQVLEILKKYRVSAVFFLLGEKMQNHQTKLKYINYQGHRLGNHGFYHMPMILRSAEKIKGEILETDRLIQQEFRQKTTLFRPPYGIWGPALCKQLKSLRKEIVLWSLMANEFKWNAEKVSSYLSKKISGGDIVVFHDNPESRTTLMKVLPDFLEFCLDQDYKFQLL